MATTGISVSALPARVSPGEAYFAQLDRKAQAARRNKGKGKERAHSDAVILEEDAAYLDEEALDDRAKALLQDLRRIQSQRLDHAQAGPSKRTNSKPTRVVYDFMTPKTAYNSCGSGGASSAPEELCWRDSTLVWSKGTAIHRLYSFGDAGDAGDGTIQQALFAYFEYPCPPPPPGAHAGDPPSTSSEATSSPPPLSSPSTSASSESSDGEALYGPFAAPKPPAWSDDNRSSLLSASLSATHTATTLTRVLCVLFTETLHLYCPDGVTHVVHLRFPVQHAWALDKGLLVQKLHRPSLLSNTPDWLRPPEIRQQGAIGKNQKAKPAFYTLLDPFADFAPISKASALHCLPRHSPHHPIRTEDMQISRPRVSGKCSLFTYPDERVLYVSNRTKGEEPLMVSYNRQAGKLSVWAYAEVKEDVSEELERLKRSQLLRAEDEGFLSPRTADMELGESIMADNAEGDWRNTSTAGMQASSQILPLSSQPVTGKRRRSTDLAIHAGVPPASSLRGVRKTSTIGLLFPDIHNPRRSSVAPQHPQHASQPGNGSVADFLDAMGTIPASRPPGHSNSAAATLRRTSTLGSSAAMDRRTSTTRNELSVSLDRMALSSQPRSSLANLQDGPHAPGARHLLSSRQQVGALAAREGELAEAMLEDRAPAAGHGDMERETSFLVGDEDALDSSSDVFISRLGSTRIDAASDSGQDIHAAVFDIRCSSSILAICVPQSKTLYLYRITRAAKDAEEPFKLSCTPLRQMDAISVAPVLCTRANVLDLLVVDSDSAASVLTADAQVMQLNVEITPRSPLSCIQAAFGHMADVLFAGGHGTFAVQMALWADTVPAKLALEALSAALPGRAFMEMYTKFLQRKRANRSHDAKAEMLALRHALIMPAETQGIPEAASDWEFLLGSVGSLASSSTTKSTKPDLSTDLLQIALLSLHLLKEEWNLLSRRKVDVHLISTVVAELASELGALDYLDSAVRDGAEHRGRSQGSQDLPNDFVRWLPPAFSVYKALQSRLIQAVATRPYEQLRDLQQRLGIEPSNFFGQSDCYPMTRQILQIYDCWHGLSSEVQHASESPSERLVLLCASLGWRAEDIDELSSGPALPIREAIRHCQLKSPELWPKAAYALLNRADQMAMVQGRDFQRKREMASVKKRMLYDLDTVCDATRNAKPISHPQHQIRKKIRDRASRFSSDLRLDDVQKMLQYISPVVMKGPEGPGITEADLPGEQQKLLLALSNRTLALPFGNAAFLYRNAQRPRSQMMPIPKAEVSAKLLPTPSLVHLSPDTLAPEMKTWSYFHSGVAIAVHIAWSPNDFEASEFALNKPNELNARHAGFLLGLGLTGQIRSLGTYQAFKYMDPKHEYTSIGLLIGLGAAYIGTGDSKVTSALSVHVAALHPPSAAQLNVSTTIQSAGLVGIGLLHLGSRNRKIADNILRDMTRLRMLATEHPDGCREGYALASSFAYGLVMLGKGNEDAAGGGTEALRTFRYLLDGSGNTHLPGMKKSVEGALDVAMTSPAAGVALALAFLQTERQDVADMMEIPQSVDRLDHVRPDLILLRTTCRALIMWCGITSTQDWIEGLVPAFVKQSLTRKQKLGIAVPYDQDMVYWNIVAGACLALGLKYAGTAKGEVHSILIEYLDRLIKVLGSSPVTASLRTKLTRHGIQTCISIVCLALSSVMAGTGELNVLRRLRVMHGQVLETVSYGTHMASHLALGLLFLGKGRYTLGTSKLATAALFCAFYPVLPSGPADNRFHLQAFRHLWVLAIEPRCLAARDVDTGKSVYLPLKLRIHERDETGHDSIRSQQLVAPTLIPDVKSIESIKTDSPRYWPIMLDFAASKTHLASFLLRQTIYVKRRAGHLSYALDPRGIRSVFTQSKSEVGSSVFDEGKIAQMLTVSKDTLSQIVEYFSASSTSAKRLYRRFCETDKDAHETEGTKLLSTFLTTAMMECLLQDKGEALTVYASLYLSLRSPPHDSQYVMARRDLLFISSFYAHVAEKLVSAKRQPLVSRGLVEQLMGEAITQVNHHLDDPDIQQSMGAYLATGDSGWTTQTKPSERFHMRALLEVLDVPSLNVLLQLRILAQQTPIKHAGITAEARRSVLTKMLERLRDSSGLGMGPSFVSCEGLAALLLQAWT